MKPSDPKTIEELLEGREVLHHPACDCGQWTIISVTDLKKLGLDYTVRLLMPKYW